MKHTEVEDASFDFHYNHSFTDIMSRKRKAQFTTDHDLKYMIIKTYDAHMPKTRLFNSPVSLFLQEDKVHDKIKAITD